VAWWASLPLEYLCANYSPSDCLKFSTACLILTVSASSSDFSLLFWLAVYILYFQ
jgi:hypothetical protein